MTKTQATAAVALALLSACGAPSGDGSTRDAAVFSPPEESGLVGVRPYPGARDVCRVIGESAATVDLLDHTELLIGCPATELGAIEDRVAEGAILQTRVGEWWLLSVPQG